ncbi:MAG: hypothetical protein ACUVWQ_03165 [Candidatus Aminicenantales bacterium]
MEEFICLGYFDPEEKIEAETQEKLDLEELSFAVEEDNWPEMQPLSIFYKERLLKPSLNEDFIQEPRLLSTVFLPELKPARITLYAQDQAAGTDETGKIFIYTLNDNRLFFLTLPQRVKNFCLLGRTFFFPEGGTKLVSISFEKEDMSIYHGLKSAILAIAPMPPDNILTAQADSSVNIWDLEEKKITTLKFGKEPLWFLAADPMGRIYFASKNRLGLADSKEKILLATKLPGEEPLFPRFFPRTKLSP